MFRFNGVVGGRNTKSAGFFGAGTCKRLSEKSRGIWVSIFFGSGATLPLVGEKAGIVNCWGVSVKGGTTPSVPGPEGGVPKGIPEIFNGVGEVYEIPDVGGVGIVADPHPGCDGGGGGRGMFCKDDGG